MIRLCLLLLAAIWPGLCRAITLDLPANAILQLEEGPASTSLDLPIGSWVEGYIPTRRAEGQVVRQVWRIDGSGLTTLQILAPLRDQIAEAGYDLLYNCQTEQCGGFDFRFGVDIAPSPAMQVDLSDFRYLAAQRTGATDPEFVMIVVSRTARAGFVQITQVSSAPDVAVRVETALTRPPPLAAAQLGDIGLQLEQAGRVVLSDLSFETGSSTLGPGPFDTLDGLATYLRDHPDRKIALVGHTDASGSLETNVALSRRRAASVLERLVSDYGVDRAQTEAEGMGYLAPIASNLTEEGREANRRVEAILTSTD
ncbi:OmpA family protein [Loktanella sp. IMCC34160]|uniref:OmpA family protein n=1 Tax=Loktanella sp. IMCC34160 TaxID=2510646 RepID=UPI00101DDB40|nr:OmpA family protein [Loktanella sp. IMCC34160]RYG91268.1 OmpA family protein [Loktanella sp. IMCC34160]